jgi:hypothetical protein
MFASPGRDEPRDRGDVSALHEWLFDIHIGKTGSGGSAARDRDDAVQLLADPPPGRAHVELVLQVEPEFGGSAQRLAEPERGVRGYRGLLAGDPLNARARNTAGLRKRAR